MAVYKDVMLSTEFEASINNKKNKLAENKQSNMANYELRKLAENHYLISYDTNPMGENNFKRQFFHIHYIYEKGAVYELELITEPERFQELTDDFVILLNSFTVK